jgi:hypothetical protein
MYDAALAAGIREELIRVFGTQSARNMEDVLLQPGALEKVNSRYHRPLRAYLSLPEPPQNSRSSMKQPTVGSDQHPTILCLEA